jgi:hypothetical protein
MFTKSVAVRIARPRSRATLMRGGRVYATGIASRLHARRAIRPGRYTMRLVTARRRWVLAVTVQ